MSEQDHKDEADAAVPGEVRDAGGRRAMSQETEDPNGEYALAEQFMERVRLVVASPGARTLTVTSLRDRIDVARKTAARLRSAYRTSVYRHGCELLAEVDDATVRACEALLEALNK